MARWYPRFLMRVLTVGVFVGLLVALVGLVRLVIAAS
jgi:hypothetical protein